MCRRDCEVSRSPTCAISSFTRTIRIFSVLLEHGGVLLSRDRGKTWEDRSKGIDYVDMHYIENYPGSQERYYVSSARGFFRSDDCGKQWYPVENGMPWADTPLYCYSHEWHFLPG